MIMQEETLTNGSIVYEAWSSSSNANYLEFYLFSIRNPDDFVNGGELEIEEIDPFVYKEIELNKRKVGMKTRH